MTIQNIKLKITSPAVKLHVVPRVTANITGQNGIAVTFQNNSWIVTTQSGGNVGSGGTIAPLMDGVASTGISSAWAHEDHVHPTDTTRAPLNSPAFTGTPTAPTRTAGDNSTNLATTAFVATSFAPLASPALTGSPTAPTPTLGDSSTKLATTAFVQSTSGSVQRSYIAGLTLSTAGSSTTFSVAAGNATDSTNTNSMTLGSALSKTTGAWVVGTGNGALDTGSIAASTWYHVHLIKRTDTNVVDVLVSLSATTPTLPTSYTVFRRIGAMKTNGSSQWTSFSQNGDEFLLGTAVQDANAVSLPTVSTLVALSIPTSVTVNAVFSFMVTPTSNSTVLIQSPSQADQTPSSVFNNIFAFGTQPNTVDMNIRTNTSAQIQIRAAGATGTYSIATFGWIDRRGRDA